MKLQIVPIEFGEACHFIDKEHRHHEAPQGHKFSIGLAVQEVLPTRSARVTFDRLVGVACVGRPVSRVRDDRWTLEVTRLATDGTKNACSKLYAAAWRSARAMGYVRLGTYILAGETGTSLKAAGFRFVHTTKGGRWDTPARRRSPTGDELSGQKQLWEVTA